MATEKKYNYLIQSVIKALDILEEMNAHNEEIGVKELSEQLGMGKSTTHRFLATLEYKGYITHVEEKKGKYHLSLKLFEMGNNILKSLDLHSRSLPVLQDLNKRMNKTVHLVVLDNGEAVFVNKLVSYPTSVTYSHIGKRSPAHCLASGKVLLAYLSHDELDAIYKDKELIQFTPNTYADLAKLKRHLVKIREEGVAYDFGEYEPNVNCVAAPIKNHLGQVVAAVSLSGIDFPSSTQVMSKLSQEIRLAADKISHNLGYSDKHS
ncbi:MAG: IclR family transcriptional regulator [Clostridia bacterium]|jgi:DNA-binding IclR family transcriptional regulator|nr:IclR family transcriptional regulator [Clostridia bacterium]